MVHRVRIDDCYDYVAGDTYSTYVPDLRQIMHSILALLGQRLHKKQEKVKVAPPRGLRRAVYWRRVRHGRQDSTDRRSALGHVHVRTHFTIAVSAQCYQFDRDLLV